MTSTELENLVRTGRLKSESPVASEIDGLIRSGEARLADATTPGLSLVGRFDLAYNAAHALSLAALRLVGYRSENRYVVFQCLPYTLRVPTATWRVLAKCHGMRNQAEYAGVLDVDERLVNDLVAATTEVRNALRLRTGPER